MVVGPRRVRLGRQNVAAFAGLSRLGGCRGVARVALTFMTRLLASTLLLALGAAACGDDDFVPEPTPEPEPELPDARIELASVEAGSTLGGDQTTKVRATSELGVLRVELFLDTMRIGVAELAPFDIAWRT